MDSRLVHLAGGSSGLVSVFSSETDWQRIDAMSDEEIDFSDAPEATPEMLARATLHPGDPRIIRQFAVTAPREVSEWFGSAPEGREEAVLAALREYMERHPRD